MTTAVPVLLSSPRAGALERIVRTPTRFCPAILAITLLGLLLDRYADLGEQILLGLCTWGFLAIALVYLSPLERAQTLVVVVVATCAEVVGSIIWGMYEYRLGNLPLFVPPGHGLVYLTGLRLSQLPWIAGRRRLLVGAAIAGVGGWALLGLTGALGRTDAAGAVGAAVLVLFLLRGRAPAVYAGVFFAVATLEIYGTLIGTWSWAAEVPGLGVGDGNPPSGAASGYVFFDISALALAPALLAGARHLRERAGSWAGRLDSRPMPAPSIIGVVRALWQERHPYTGPALLISLDTDDPAHLDTFEIHGELAERLAEQQLGEGSRVRVECRREIVEAVDPETGETSDHERAVVVDVVLLGAA